MEVYSGIPDSENVVYRFSAYVQKPDGSRLPISIAIEAAAKVDEGQHTCRLHFPFLRDRPFLISGVDDEQALELARDFLISTLKHSDESLVDESGLSVTLPPLPETFSNPSRS